MKKCFLFLIILNSCTLSSEYKLTDTIKEKITNLEYFNNPLKKREIIPLDFDKDYTVNEFREILNIYSQQNDYPNIN